MKSIPLVCLIAVASAVLVSAHDRGQTPPPSRGVTVQLVATTNAVAFPEADDADAWIISITADGRLYFGVLPVTFEQLQQEMKTAPYRRDARLYVKSDARAPFSALKQALHAAYEDRFETAVLLTGQSLTDSPPSFVPPYGLEVSLFLSNTEASIVQVQDSGGPSNVLKVNGQQLAWSELQDAITQSLRGQRRKIVVIEGDANIAVAPVVRVVDRIRSTDANVAISLTGI